MSSLHYLLSFPESNIFIHESKIIVVTSRVLENGEKQTEKMREKLKKVT